MIDPNELKDGHHSANHATGQQHEKVVNIPAIPLVFVPGIMGSRLRSADGSTWDPDDPLNMLLNYGLVNVSPAEKKRMVIGKSYDKNFLRVMTEPGSDCLAAHPDAKSRGWGEVAWSSYGTILTYLDAFTERIAKSKKDAKPIHPMKCFPVYAVGYNWSASNRSSGQRLADRIGVIYEENKPCDGIILITHSMGGLVARAACKLGANYLVLGIIHGVQPVSGAPAAYWRMKAGFERDDIRSTLAAFVLGKSGEYVTALLGNMPGGLQLLPSHLYKTGDDGKGWLQIAQSGHSTQCLPSNGDPYAEIYLERKTWWRLINERWLDPGGENLDRSGNSLSWNAYEALLKEAESFHKNFLSRFKHRKTYDFYGSGGTSTAHCIRYVVKQSSFWSRLERGVKHVALGAATDALALASAVVAGALLGAAIGGLLGAALAATGGLAGARGSILGSGLAGAAAGAMIGAVIVGALAVVSGIAPTIASAALDSGAQFTSEFSSTDGHTYTAVLQDPSGAGDGTVSESSGRALGGDKAIPNIGHESAYNDYPAVHEYVDARLLDLIPRS